MINYSDYLNFAKDISKESGALLKEGFRLGREKNFKDDNTAITDLDEQMNKMVIDRVKKTFPEHGVLGEEQSFDQKSDYIWVCDPIDGTLQFMTGIPTFVFSITHGRERRSFKTGGECQA